jgi:hypothetical protein
MLTAKEIIGVCGTHGPQVFYRGGLNECGNPRYRCKVCISTYLRAYRQKNKERDHAATLARNRRSWAKHRVKRAVAVKEWRAILISEVIAEYGGKCCCCGETHATFLTIDHVNHNGREHSRQIGSGALYRWLRKNGYPKDGFRLMCYNCNCGRERNAGVCEHEAERVEMNYG